MTATVADAGVDVSVNKREVFDVEMARWLLELKEGLREKEDRMPLRKLYKARKNGNQHDATYKLGKELKSEDVGRWIAKGGVGLQCLSRDIRAALAQKYYWDVDMRNAQPTLLVQYAEKRGWVCEKVKYYITYREDLLTELMEAFDIDRDEAKERVIELCFGHSATPDRHTTFFVKEFQPEMATLMRNVFAERSKDLGALAKRGVRSVMAFVLQTEERKCLMALDVSLARQGRSLDTFIHDGGLVRKKDGETHLSEDILRKAERDIAEATGYKISLVVKELKTTFEREEGDDLLPSDVLVDDAYAAQKFVDLMGGRIVRDGTVWIFDDTTGIWTTDETVLNRKMAVDFREQLVFRQMGAMGIRVFNYSGDVAHQDRLRRALPAQLPSQEGYFNDRIESSVNKILFTNGIYDIKTGLFTEGFDPEIVFFGNVPRAFPTERNEEAIAFVRKVFFRDPFVNPAVGDALLHWVARALAGGYEAKKVVIPYGPANSAKGTLCKHLETTFGEALVGSFTGDSLLLRTGDVEATKSLSWIKQICDKRIAYSNEITIDPNKRRPINGNLVKTLSGGGDRITLRTNHKDEEKVVNKSIVFTFVNDLPDISPVDGSVRDRLVTIPYSYSFVDTPVLPLEKKRDHTISSTLKTNAYRDATIWLILDTLKAWDGKPYPLPAECNALKEDLAPMTDLREILGEEFDLTGDPDDFVTTEDLVAYLRARKVDGSDRKIGDRLTQIGLTTEVKREGRRTVRVRVGIRRAE